jgi:serine protease Do
VARTSTLSSRRRAGARLALAGLLLGAAGCYGEVHEVHHGRLEPGDPVLEQDQSFYDSYEFKAKAGYRIVLELESDDFDAYVHLMDADGKQLVQNDDVAPNDTNARLEFTAPSSGTYFALANSFHGNSAGAYELTITAAPADSR